MNRRSLRHATFAVTLTLAAAAGCGGNSEDGGGAAGTSGSAGGGAGGTGGGAGGTSGSAGSSGSGGSGGVDCSLVDCPAIDCGPGTKSVTRPGECCAVCVPEDPGQCGDVLDECDRHPGCAPGYSEVEYAPGCCACRLDRCDALSCPEPAGCAPGESLVYVGDACCPTCVPENTCEDGGAPCEQIRCADGYRPFDVGGACCLGCEPDPDACKDEREAYHDMRSKLLSAPDARSCTTDDDCVIVSLHNECDGDCGTSVAASEADAIVGRTAEYAAKACAHCPPISIGCPAVVLEPYCDAGTCGAKP